MRAVVFGGDHTLSLREVPRPECRTGEVLVRVGMCGICGTDLHSAQLAELFGTDVAIGHEFAGTIEQIGPGVVGYRPGDRVVVNPILLGCGACAACARGLTNLCLVALAHGAVGIGRDGGLAEYVVVEQERLHRLPDVLSLAQGALVEPLAVAVHGIRRGEVRPGDRTAVIGAGPVGMLTTQVALARGATEVVVVEPSATRRERAAAGGAHAALHPDAAGDLGERFDQVVDCSGAPAAFPGALAMARPGGVLVVIGTHTGPVTIPEPIAVHAKGLDVRFSMGYDDSTDFAGAIELLRRGRVDVGPIVSGVVPLADFRRAFDAMAAAEDAVKVLVECR